MDDFIAPGYELGPPIFEYDTGEQHGSFKITHVGPGELTLMTNEEKLIIALEDCITALTRVAKELNGDPDDLPVIAQAKRCIAEVKQDTANKS